MPQTNFTTEILPQKSRAELSGTEFIKFLELKKESKKKNYNRNVFSVRTNDNISSLIREYCQLKNISTNQFFNNLLNSHFNQG